MRYQVFISGEPRDNDRRPPKDGNGPGERVEEARIHEHPASQRAFAGKDGRTHTQSGRYRAFDPQTASGDGAAYQGEAPPSLPVMRRFPPVLQFLTSTDPLIEQQIRTVAEQAHRKRRTLQKVCEEVYYFARSVGYEAALGVQEVYSSNMPSFPDQIVASALLMVDLNKIDAPAGYHQGRMEG